MDTTQFSDIKTEIMKEAIAGEVNNEIREQSRKAPQKVMSILDTAKVMADEIKSDIRNMFKENHINKVNALQLASEGVDNIEHGVLQGKATCGIER